MLLLLFYFFNILEKETSLVCKLMTHPSFLPVQQKVPVRGFQLMMLTCFMKYSLGFVARYKYHFKYHLVLFNTYM